MKETHPIMHEPDRGRFILKINGRESVLKYMERDGAMDILSTVVDVRDRGNGIAAQLTEAALAYAREKNLRIIPTCSYTAAYLKRHDKSGSPHQ